MALPQAFRFGAGLCLRQNGGELGNVKEEGKGELHFDLSAALPAAKMDSWEPFLLLGGQHRSFLDLADRGRGGSLVSPGG